MFLSSIRFARFATRLALLLSIASLPCLAAPIYGYKVVAQYPHSRESYTEGFFYLNGLFYEGTGMTGHSAILAIQPETGQPVQHTEIPAQYFGEGIVDWGPNLIEWTWQTHIGFVYDRFSLRVLSQFRYVGEGWGMTRTTKELITSDGTSTLRFRDPNTFAETHHIVVHDGGQPVEQLNELEYIPAQPGAKSEAPSGPRAGAQSGTKAGSQSGDEIYANVWHSDRIARISPLDGHVIAWIDLAGILPEDQKVNAESVLNGIAYDAQHKRLFVTGKQWPSVFEIKIDPKPRQ